MILARNSITLHHLRDITTVVWYYKLQASTASPPPKPTTETPSGWSTTEPSYTEGSTNSLYVVQKTTFSDGTFEYSNVSLSSSYEASKAAYAKSVQAKDAADTALQQSVWYAVCDTAAATTAKTATITPATTDFVLQAGVAVNVKFTNTNSGAVGSLTLNVNGTGAKPIKYINNNGAPGNIAGANYLRSGNMYQFSYDGSNWIIHYNYNTNNYDRSQYGIALAASEEIAAGRIGVLGTNGKLHLLNTTAFDIKCPPLYVGTAYSAANVTDALARNSNYCYWGTAFNLTSTHAVTGAAAGKSVYIVGTLSGDTFTPNSTVLTCTEPTSENNLYYMRLGRMNTAANAVLEMEHPIYVYYDGKFRSLREAEELKAAKTANNYISADNTGLMVANMADGNTYTPSNVPSGTKNTFIDEDSFQVRDGTTVLASFGEESQIGKDNENHQIINANGTQYFNADGVRVFDVNMAGADKLVRIKSNSERLVFTPDSALDGDVVLESARYGNEATTITVLAFVSYSSSAGPIRRVNFTRGTEETKTVETTVDVTTYHYYQDEWTERVEIHFEKHNPTNSSITFSFSYLYTSYCPTFSLGTRSGKEGVYSGIIGESLTASTEAQFACGRYNEDSEDYAFMIGNGSMDAGESNAFAVTWDGNQLLALDETAASGTDAELYSAITSLGWESEVLV